MKFKNWLQTEINKGLERHFRQTHPHLPSYVAKQALHNRVRPLFKRSLVPPTMPDTDASSFEGDFMHDDDNDDEDGSVSRIYGHDKVASIAQTKNWEQKVIEIHPLEFSPRSIQSFYAHKFGRSEALSQRVRDHDQRLATQQRLASERGENNEPIMIRKLKDGYEMEEGWHRLYAYIYNSAPPEEKAKMDNGQYQTVDLSKWRPFRINAFIGS